MNNAGRKTEVLDEFGVWAPNNIKKKRSITLLKYLFVAVPNDVYGCLTNMTQIFA